MGLLGAPLRPRPAAALALGVIASLACRISAFESFEEELSERKRADVLTERLQGLAASMRTVGSSGGGEGAFGMIAGFADEAEAALESAASAPSLERRLEILEKTLAKKGEWIGSLQNMQAGLRRESGGEDEADGNAHHEESEEDGDPVERLSDNMREKQAELKAKLEQLRGLVSKSGDSDSAELAGRLERLASLVDDETLLGGASTLEDLLGSLGDEDVGVEAPEEVEEEEKPAPAIPERTPEQEAAQNEEAFMQAARLFQKAAREGAVEQATRFLTALGRSDHAVQQVLNYQDKVGATALHWCAFYGSKNHIELAKQLLQIGGVNPTIKDRHARSACHTACAKGNHAMLAVLLEGGRGKSCLPLGYTSDGQNCIHLASGRGDAATLEVLRKTQYLTPETVDMPTQGDSGVNATGLWFAIQVPSPDAVRVLVEAGADPKLGRSEMRGEDGELDMTASMDLAQERMESYISMLEVMAPGWDSDDGDGEPAPPEARHGGEL